MISSPDSRGEFAKTGLRSFDKPQTLLQIVRLCDQHFHARRRLQDSWEKSTRDSARATFGTAP
jgi:hypothetical protein